VTSPLKPVHFHILLVLLRGPLHGYGIVKEIEESTGGSLRLEPGNLYRYIGQLRRAGFVAEVDPDPKRGEGDERRRYYEVTQGGRNALEAEVDRMKGLVIEAESHLRLAEGPGGEGR
jgi:DNA-binding PadR family transcriptional regulator